MQDQYARQIEVVRVVDGDTYDVFVDLGFAASMKIRVRLKGIDTPETWRPRNEAEAKHGQAAKEFVAAAFSKYSATMQTFKDRASIYGRWTADIYLQTGASGQVDEWELLADMLRDEGFEKLAGYPDEPSEEVPTSLDS